jgi:hypothetical protein
MSLVRIAARIAAVQALKGQTSVGDNVLDSEIGALDVDGDGNLRSTKPKPFISVYTDEARADDNQLRAWVGNGRTEFLFEAGVTAAHADTDTETGDSLLYPGVPDTDAAFEFHLDLIARQIGDALSDPENEWAEIFRKFTKTIVRIERSRTSSGAKDGTRLAAHQVKVTVELVSDPPKGEPLSARGPMALFFAKAAELPGLSGRISLMQAQLIGAPLEWEASMRRFGIAHSEADSLLITPATGADGGLPIVAVNAQPAQIAGGQV